MISQLPAQEKPLANDSPSRHTSSRYITLFLRLFDRTVGSGFKLTVWETPTLHDQTSIMAWLRPLVAAHSIRLIEVDLALLFGGTKNFDSYSTNIWRQLTQTIPPASVADHRAVLVLKGFEEFMHFKTDGRQDLLQQFNVQRELFVRDYPCW